MTSQHPVVLICWLVLVGCILLVGYLMLALTLEWWGRCQDARTYQTRTRHQTSAADAVTREGRRVEHGAGSSAAAPLATSAADTCTATWGAGYRCLLAPGHDGPHMPPDRRQT